MDNDQALLTGLPPILDAEVETLILGSFPSPASLAAGQYYAHRQNQFWRIMSALTGEPLTEFDYAGRQRGLLRHCIGVWDVYRRCRRQGALDSVIRNAETNDFASLRIDAPALRRIGFNGKTSGRTEGLLRGLGYDTCLLPSTSPAYTLDFELKLMQWRAALATRF